MGDNHAGCCGSGAAQERAPGHIRDGHSKGVLGNSGVQSHIVDSVGDEAEGSTSRSSGEGGSVGGAHREIPCAEGQKNVDNGGRGPSDLEGGALYGSPEFAHGGSDGGEPAGIQNEKGGCDRENLEEWRGEHLCGLRLLGCGEKVAVGKMSAGGGEVVRLEEFTGLLQNKLVAVWQPPEAAAAWMPTEFMLSAYVTRILVTGRTAALSTVLTADPSWTQVWRAPGGKEWSCLMGLLQHCPGPILLVVGPDVALSARLVTALQGARSGATILVLRSTGPGAAGWVGDAADQVFLPVLESGPRFAGLLVVLQEWLGRTTAPKSLDTKTLLPQLAAAGYGLTASEGTWYWYRPAESTGVATLTVPQIARQLMILGSVLERATV